MFTIPVEAHAKKQKISFDLSEYEFRQAQKRRYRVGDFFPVKKGYGARKWRQPWKPGVCYVTVMTIRQLQQDTAVHNPTTLSLTVVDPGPALIYQWGRILNRQTVIWTWTPACGFAKMYKKQRESKTETVKVRRTSISDDRYFGFDRYTDARLMRAITLRTLLSGWGKYLNMKAKLDLNRVKRVDGRDGFSVFCSHTWASGYHQKVLTLMLKYGNFAAVVVAVLLALLLSIVGFGYRIKLGKVDENADLGTLDYTVLNLTDWPRKVHLSSVAPGLSDAEPFTHEPFPSFKIAELTFFCVIIPLQLSMWWLLPREKEDDKIFLDRCSIEQDDTNPDKKRGIRCVSKCRIRSSGLYELEQSTCCPTASNT